MWASLGVLAIFLLVICPWVYCYNYTGSRPTLIKLDKFKHKVSDFLLGTFVFKLPLFLAISGILPMLSASMLSLIHDPSHS